MDPRKIFAAAQDMLAATNLPPSVCLLQRRLQLPYPFACKIHDLLEKSMTPAVAAFTDVVRRALDGPNGYLDRSGATLYSEAHTLRPGIVYLLGTNPGGSDDGKNTIQCSLSGLPHQKNAYLDEEWDTGLGKGKALLQQRVQALLEKGLGLQTRDVCAANLVFQRTSRIAGLNFWKAADSCWPIHEHILEVVRPKLLIAFGSSATSAYSYLAAKLQRLGEPVEIDAQHGSWKCRGFRTLWQGREMYVAGIPHMSYYSPLDSAGAIKGPVRKWLREATGLPAYLDR